MVLFGFSAGDFIIVGKLIFQVVDEFRKPPNISPSSSSLKALRAFKNIQTLRPAKHEFIHLVAIQANALACRKPLKGFPQRVSKFENCLGSFGITKNKCTGFHRRLQYRLLYMQDVEKLRLQLTSHVTTIRFLLMTQAVTSISVAEDDRERLASNLETKILDNRRLLRNLERSRVWLGTRAEKANAHLGDQSSTAGGYRQVRAANSSTTRPSTKFDPGSDSDHSIWPTGINVNTCESNRYPADSRIGDDEIKSDRLPDAGDDLSLHHLHREDEIDHVSISSIIKRTYDETSPARKYPAASHKPADRAAHHRHGRRNGTGLSALYAMGNFQKSL
ncbi:hypothetical protein P154DRAFT_573992 [Amniculicola lignicola CBS 123094]|uniref:Uncharacterized protein n=1 Tax=Amniculicola lignicola CBS 123094 TaxID=1392246 RepID=A0A6A5WKG8_9PLEO|nr:hypothetical protein P154DRAFT_573992 [Amniculicola lignicola CBS 123094]